ncbi:MAG: hypothetical protein NT133_14685 [Alphaproteobacteria bacterium]|nr:hypothetical protein [Alphaproteobacteria bacterium]
MVEANWVQKLHWTDVNDLTGIPLSVPFYVLRLGLPDFANFWLVYYEDQPFLFAWLLLTLALIYSYSSRLRQRIQAWTKAAWSASQATKLADQEKREQEARRKFGWLVWIGALILGAAALLFLGPFNLGRDDGALWMIRSVVLALLYLVVLTLAAGAAVTAIGLEVFGLCGSFVDQPGEATARRSKPRNWSELHFARWCRTDTTLRAGYRVLREHILPGISLLVTAVMLLWLPVAKMIDVRSGIEIADTCHAAPTQPGAEGQPSTFDLACEWWDSGVQVEKNVAYRITLTMPDRMDWFDKTVHTDTAGFPSRDAFRRFMAVTKRRWFDNWFQPIAHIQSDRWWDEKYALAPPNHEPSTKNPTIREATLTADEQQRYQQLMDKDKFAKTHTTAIEEGTAKAATELFAEARQRARLQDLQTKDTAGMIRVCHDRHRIAYVDFTPSSPGRVLLYVNDAVRLWPGTNYYGNNRGTAEVKVERLSDLHDKDPPAEERRNCEAARK